MPLVTHSLLSTKFKSQVSLSNMGRKMSWHLCFYCREHLVQCDLAFMVPGPVCTWVFGCNSTLVCWMSIQCKFYVGRDLDYLLKTVASTAGTYPGMLLFSTKWVDEWMNRVTVWIYHVLITQFPFISLKLHTAHSWCSSNSPKKSSLPGCGIHDAFHLNFP